MHKVKEVIKIADIHAQRINSAIRHTQHLLPMTAENWKILPENDFVWIDLLINRFGKLQDIIGAKIIDLFLEAKAENIESLTLLDKLHKLEKLGIIDDAEVWKEMRTVRNHVAHEYPDKPELTAEYINRIFSLTPYLLKILQTLKNSN